MATSVVPLTKGVYLCDDALEDQVNRKVHLLGVFNALRPQPSISFPYRLNQLCVFAQLVGGVGDAPIHVEVVQGKTDLVIYTYPEQHLNFPTRQTTVSACFRIRNLSFPDPGVYFVELYCQDTFLDDRAIYLISREEAES